jgi:Uncharacterized flagellar protein FlaG
MEVKSMYIETMNNAAVNAPVAAPVSTTKPVAAAKPVTQTAADNSVRVETTDGENTQVQEGLKQNYKANKTNANDVRSAEEKKSAENEKIKKAISKMNAQLPNSEVKFGIHEKTERVTIKLIDRETKEVIKEFPPEKTLDMIAKCMELAGVLMDEKL